MRRYVVTAAIESPGWCVECEGQTLASHFSLGEALTDAMQRARHEAQFRGRAAQVLRRGNDGHTVVMLTLSPEDVTPSAQAKSA